MVIKTTTCAFSEQKIYPGRGVIFIRRDGKKFQFADPKMRHLFLDDRKPLKCRWNKAWRRANKKESVLRQVKKEKRRTIKQDRGIEGLTLQDLLAKKNATVEKRKEERKARVAEMKDKSKNEKKSIKQRLRELKKKQESDSKPAAAVTTGNKQKGKGGKGDNKKQGGKGGKQAGKAQKGGKAKGASGDAQKGGAKGGKGKGGAAKGGAKGGKK